WGSCFRPRARIPFGSFLMARRRKPYGSLRKKFRRPRTHPFRSVEERTMPVVSSDTLVIEKTPVTVATSWSLAVINASLNAAPPSVIAAVFGNPAKHPSVLPVVFQADDTVQDWVGLSKKLETFRSLKSGWDGYNAAPPDPRSLESATAFLGMLRQN